MADQYAGWSDPVPAKAPPDPYADWSDPVPASKPEGQPFLGGVLDMIPGSHKLAAGVNALGDYVHGSDLGDAYEGHLKDVDERFDAERASPRFTAGQIAAMLSMPGPSGLKGMAMFGAAQGAGDARGGFGQTLADAGMGGVIGAGIHGAGAVLSNAADSTLPWLKRLEGKLTNQIGDRGVVDAEKTAKSAIGSYGKSRADAGNILEKLQSRTGDAATDAASDSLLNSPQGATLRREVVQGAQQRAPEALNNIDSLRTLMQQAQADIPVARATATADDTLRSVLKQRTKDQLSRYVLPVVGGAAGTYVGNKVDGPTGAAVGFGIGAAAGRGVSPGVRAVVLNNVLAPERKLLAARRGISAGSKLAQLAQSNPQALGKFAAPLTQAAARGADAIAATHYTLSQDPEYQQLSHDVAENDQ